MARTFHPLPRPTASPATPSVARPGRSAQRLRAGHPASRHTGAVADGAELTLDIRWGGRRPLVEVSGELDLAGADLFAALLAHVRATDPGPIAVDLGRVSFIDSHGLSPALARDVVLVAASPVVARVLRLLGLPIPPPGEIRHGVGRPRRGRPRSGGA
ncbi:STAS domain-containing protein [Blastococcus sp. SYSU DS0753]